MFSGLISRWTMPASCAAASALATWIVRSSASVHRDGPTRQPLPQRFAFDQLARDIVRRVILTDLVNGQDVRMIERDDRLRFLFKSPESLRVAGKARGSSFKAALRPVLMSVAR